MAESLGCGRFKVYGILCESESLRAVALCDCVLRELDACRCVHGVEIDAQAARPRAARAQAAQGPKKARAASAEPVNVPDSAMVS